MSDRIDDLVNEVHEMRAEMIMLTRGLISMNESVGNLNTALENILDQMTPDENDDNPTAEALRGLIVAVNTNGAQVSQMREALTGAMLRGGPTLSAG